MHQIQCCVSYDVSYDMTVSVNGIEEPHWKNLKLDLCIGKEEAHVLKQGSLSDAVIVGGRGIPSV